MLETLAIAGNVFRQMLRNRILAVLTLCALAMTGVVVFLSDLGQEAQMRLVRDFGLLSLEAVGFFTILLSQVVLLFEESELKTYQMLLVRPIERGHALAGRTLGTVFLMLMNQAGMLVLLWLLGKARGLDMVDGDFLVGALYLALGGALFSTVTAFFSVMASSVPAAAMFSTFAFALGHFTTNLLEWTQRMRDPVLSALVRALYWVTPNFGLFNLADTLDKAGISAGAQGFGVFAWPWLYAAAYGSVALGLAWWRYERKDF